ncbi:MAG: hypothetical protein EA376_10050 [Phycisphaeraceae bacterium]|nr:MAG: hypothetical protein EA376_10050 [Phycisphaeraceae bacterium]
MIFQSRVHSSVLKNRKNSGRPSRAEGFVRRPRPAAILITLIATLTCQGLFAPVVEARQNTDERNQDAAATLLAEDATDEQRLAAARSLLVARRLPPLIEALSGEAPASSGIAVAAAIRQQRPTRVNGAVAGAPDELLQPLISLLERVDSSQHKVIALEALTVYPTRDAIRAVMSCIGTEHPAPVRLAAFNALRRQTGQEQLGTDVERWTNWWNEVQWLPEGDWRNLLARAQAQRAARLEQERNALADRIVETHRRLYAATPHTDRSPLLAQMMRDELPGLRRLAFELADRELLNARPLGESVLAAAVERLADDAPEIRAVAATLAGNLAGAVIHPRVLEALEREQDPQAATAMLSVAARRPDGAGVRVALKWLDSGHLAATPAAELLLAAAERGLLISPRERNAVRVAVRRRMETSPTPVLVRLLGVIGDSEDRDRVAEMLESPSLEIRLAAADALAPLPEWFDRIISVARNDPELHAMARRSITLHRPTAEGWLLLRSIDAATEQDARESLDRLSGLIGPREALRLAESLDDPGERVALLELRRNAAMERPGLISIRLQLRLAAALAEARLILGEPDGALEATDGLLESLPPEKYRSGRRRIAEARAAAHLWLGSLEAPEVAEAPPSLWLEALERCIADSLEHASDLLVHIEGALLEAMSESEIERFRTIVDRFPAALRATGEAADAGDVDPTERVTGETGRRPDSSRVADGDEPDQFPN